MHKPTINVWINQAGSPRVHAIRMLRDNPDDWPVRVFATRTDTNNPSQQFADVGGPEPEGGVPDAEYAQFAVTGEERVLAPNLGGRVFLQQVTIPV